MIKKATRKKSSPLEQRILKEEILQKFKMMKMKNPRFSLRGMARHLGLGPTSLSEFLNGKRNFSHKMAIKLALKLNISPEKMSHFKKATPEETIILNKQEWELIDRWDILGVYELLKQKKSLELISRKFNINPKTVKANIETLKMVGLLKPDLTTKKYELQFFDSYINKENKKKYLDACSHIKKKIDHQSGDATECVSFFITFPPSDLKKVSKMFQKFQESLNKTINAENGEVFEIFFAATARSK